MPRNSDRNGPLYFEETRASLDLRGRSDHYHLLMSVGENGEARKGSHSANSIWRARVREFSDRVAFRFRVDGVWHGLTWSQADQAARELAAGLLSLGLGRGDRVGILSQTRLEWVLCDVAISLAGPPGGWA